MGRDTIRYCVACRPQEAHPLAHLLPQWIAKLEIPEDEKQAAFRARHYAPDYRGLASSDGCGGLQCTEDASSSIQIQVVGFSSSTEEAIGLDSVGDFRTLLPPLTTLDVG